MDTYTLYLDEILPNNQLQYFCLAGIIVHNDTYANKIIPSVNSIKSHFFDNTSIILHESDIRYAKSGQYIVMKSRAKLNEYAAKVNELFQTQDFKVLAVSIHEGNLKRLYPNLRDKYFIGLQVILENFVNFLERHNAIGNILIESRNPEQDEQLQKHYHNLKASGTLFYKESTLQKHVGTISFPTKSENIIGLQIADMIPNSLNRYLSAMDQKIPGLIESIQDKIYDGLVGENDRFGIKVIPRIKK